MFSSSTFLSLLLITASLSNASPIQRDLGNSILRMASQIGGLGTKTLVELDRARALALHDNARIGKRSGSTAVVDSGISFTAKVGVGSPATEYTLLVDTGSSNTWIGANNSASYHPTKTSKRLPDYIAISYGSGQMSGDTYSDQVTLGANLAIKNQPIGVATESRGFGPIDGILGLGPADLTKGTLSNPHQNKTVPTVLDNLYKQKSISVETLGVYFAPSPSTDLPIGELSFGAVDMTRIVGNVHYVPVTKNTVAGKYWGIDQSISYDGEELLKESAGIVDTGTTLILINNSAFQKYEKATGGTVDSNTGLLKITAAQFSVLKNLDFKIGTHTYSLVPDAQIWPRALNSKIGGEADSIYLVVRDFGNDSDGIGFEFVNGFAFLQRFYSVYDTTNHRVGFAKTAVTAAKTNY